MTDTAREGLGRREEDQETLIARKVVGWFVTAGAAVVFAAGLWAADTRSRIVSLEHGQFTREEAAKLTGSMDLLRQEIFFLRNEMERNR